MKYLLWLFIPILLLGQVKTVTQTGVKRSMIRGDATTLTWTVSGDYSSDSLLFIAVDNDSNAVLRLTTSGGLTASYSGQRTTITGTIYAATTENFISGGYLYDISSVTDSITLIMGLLTVIADVSNLEDTVLAPIPYYTVALDTPAANNNFIIGMDSNNVWYQKTLAQTKTILGIDTLSGNVNVDLDSLYTKTSHIVNVKEFGAVGNGTTEDSLAFQNALQYLYDNGGGTLEIPEGNYLISSQLIVPHSSAVGGSYYTNVPIKIVGSGNYSQSSGVSVSPIGGTILKFAYSGAKDYFMITYGTGTLSLEGITFLTTVASKSFIKIIGTTSYIKNCSFYGAGSGASASNDAILLGGGNYVADFLTDSSAFQGYGTVIKENFFSKVRRNVYGLTYCNGVQIRDNTTWNTCGTNIDSVAAYDFKGDNVGGTNVNSGMVISGNLIEANHYWYAIRGYVNFLYNILTDNTIWDVTGSSTFKAAVRLQNGSGYNYITLTNFSALFETVSEDSSSLHKSTLICTQQQIPSRFPEPIDFYSQSNYYSSSPIKLYHTDTYRYWNYFLSSMGGHYDIDWRFIDSLTNYTPFKFTYYPNTLTVLQLGSEGRIQSASGELRLAASGVSSVWLGQANKIYITSDGILNSTLSTGLAPFSIASTTPVSNLTVNRIYDPNFLGVAQTDLDMNTNGINKIGSINFGLLQEDTTGLDVGEVYKDPKTNLLYVTNGATVAVNGDFTNWTGDNPDNWSHSVEDAGNYVTEDPAGKCKVVVDGTNHTWSIYQNVLTIGVEYGYSFDITEITDSLIVGIGGKSLCAKAIGHFSGTRVATGIQLVISENWGAASITIDNFKVWQISGGVKQVPIYDKPFTISYNYPFTSDPDLFLEYTNYAQYWDSIAVFDIQDSLAFQIYYDNGSVHDLIAIPDTLTSDTTLVFDTSEVPAGSKVYLQFIYLGDSETYIRAKAYRREER